jgi:DNA-binding winged helix-turn-helix (wHTH) protein
MSPSNKPGEVVQTVDYHHFLLDQMHPETYRREEVEALAHAIHARENRLVVGPPGAGVSNLLRFLVTHKSLVETLAGPPVTITFAYLGCETLIDPLDHQTFFAKIAQQLYEQGLNKVGDTVPGYDRLEQLLTRMDKKDPWHRIVIVVDNADRVLETVEGGFYQNLKGLTNYNKRVCLLVGVEPRTSQRVDPENLLFAGREVRVGWLNRRDFAGAIKEEGQRLGREFNAAERDRLIDLLGGQPGLLRAVSSAVREETLDLADPEGTLIERLLERDDVQYRCQKVWDALDSPQQEGLQLLAEGQLDTVSAGTLAWLHDFGLVVADNAAYRLFSPVFQGFVADQEIREPVMFQTPSPTLNEADQDTRPGLQRLQDGTTLKPETELECITVDKPTTIVADGREIVMAGNVFKGNEEIKVAPLELRLIACLKREQRVYTQSEISEYVYYQDYKPGDGVPDPRIHNLVRQIRKRLGKDYIKTYHGQGYKFVDGYNNEDSTTQPLT